MGSYGRDFAAIYDRAWSPWTDHMWPVISRLARRGAPDGRRWLDLCCGTGGLLRLAARAGYETAGVDASPHQLAFARRNAPGARLWCRDVRSFTPPGKWDVVTCMYDSLNYILEAKGVARAIKRAEAALAPGGVLIFDVNTVESHAAFWNHTDVERGAGDIALVEGRFDPVRRLGRIAITGFVKKGQAWRRFDEVHFQRSYRRGVIEGMLRRLGLSFVTYERPKGERLKRTAISRRGLLFVCRRIAR